MRKLPDQCVAAPSGSARDGVTMCVTGVIIAVEQCSREAIDSNCAKVSRLGNSATGIRISLSDDMTSLFVAISSSHGSCQGANKR
jgi:hypothetical protein